MLLILALLAAAPQTQAQLTRSAGTDFTRADAAMNAQWKRTYAYMKGRDAQDTSRGGGFGYAAAALASQRAWLQYRDTQCVLEGGAFAGGSAQPMAQASCKAMLTTARTAQLKTLIWSR
jgi:uncharacterized protein YecT (DUF1311 family)